MFLKLNMSPNLNNPANVAEPLIWNTLMPNDIDEYDNNENEEDDDEVEEDDNDNDEDDEDDDLSPVRIESEKANYACWF